MIASSRHLLTRSWFVEYNFSLLVYFVLKCGAGEGWKRSVGLIM
jgi:hypothetical protein